MILLSYALARLVLLLKKYKVPMIVVIVTVLFSALWFMNACLAISMIKDTLYSHAADEAAMCPLRRITQKVFFLRSHTITIRLPFWKFYLEIGLQFPKDYVVAFLSNSLGFWYPGVVDFTCVEYYNYPVEWFTVPLERQSLADIKIVDAYYANLCTSPFWRTTPVINLFFSPGYIPWLLILVMILAWKNVKQYFKMLPLFI